MVRWCGRALALLTTLLLLLFGASRSAYADDATVRAKLHFENGIHLYDQTPPDYEGALAEFRAAEKEKPSPGLKKNIALCLRALHRYGEAIDELEAMLAAGDALKPETRATGTKMLADLNALVATVRLKIILHKSTDKQAVSVIPHVDVSVDGVAIPSDKLGAPVRVGPGEHLFTAHAAGYDDTTKKASVVSGDHDVPVQLDLMPAATGAALGSLRVHASDGRATISIDGVALANGTWEGALPVGPHHVEAALDGQPKWSRDVDILAGVRLEIEATLGSVTTTARPPPYAGAAPKPAAKPDRRWYLQGGFGLMTGTQTVAASEFSEAAPETDRGFNGIALTAKVGRKMTKTLSLEIWGELGGFKPINYDAGDATFAYGQIGPELRLHSNGSVRIFAGTGLGLELDVLTVNGKNGNPSNKGKGVEGAWLLETGLQVPFGDRFYFEASLLMDVSGNGSITDDSTKQRYFLDSPWVRGGLRVQLGFDL